MPNWSKVTIIIIAIYVICIALSITESTKAFKELRTQNVNMCEAFFLSCVYSTVFLLTHWQFLDYLKISRVQIWKQFGLL